MAYTMSLIYIGALCLALPFIRASLNPSVCTSTSFSCACNNNYLPTTITCQNLNDTSFSSMLTQLDQANALLTVDIVHSVINTLGGPGYSIPAALTLLRVFSMSGCQLKTVDSAAFSGPFSQLATIDLSDNNLQDLNSALFIPVEGSLTSVDMSQNNIGPYLEVSFANFQNLQTVNFSDNSIKYLHSDFLEGNSALETLDLSFNLIGPIFNASLSSTVLTTVSLTHNHLETLEDDLFALTTGMQTVDISYNSLGSFFGTTFSSLANLQTINLEHNSIQTLTSLFVGNNTGLLSIDLSNNFIGPTLDIKFNGLSNLTTFNMENNLLQQLADDLFSTTKSLVTVDISSNKLGPTLDVRFDSLPNLQTICLADNDIVSVSSNFVGDNPSLLRVDLSHNLIGPELNASFAHSSTLETLILTDNQLVNLHADLLGNNPSLTTLDLSVNQIGPVLGVSLSDLPSLLHVELSSNALEALSSSLLSSAMGLTYFNISDNQLGQTLDVSWVANSQNLQTFSASNNPGLTALVAPSSTSLPVLSSLLLTSDPLYCSCQQLWLQRVANQVSMNGGTVDAVCGSPTVASGKSLASVTLPSCYLNMPKILVTPNIFQCYYVTRGFACIVFPGSSITLVCEVTGSPAPSVWWTGPFNSAVNGPSLDPQSTTTFANFTLTKITTNNGGMYTCNANSTGEGTVQSSASVVLLVDVPMTTTTIATTRTKTTEVPTTLVPTTVLATLQTEQMVLLQKSTEHQSTERQSTKQPSTEQQSTEQQSTEQQSTEQQSTEQPSTEQPSTEQPSTFSTQEKQLSTVLQSNVEQPTSVPTSDKEPSTENLRTDPFNIITEKTNPGRQQDNSDGIATGAMVSTSEKLSSLKIRSEVATTLAAHFSSKQTTDNQPDLVSGSSDPNSLFEATQPESEPNETTEPSVGSNSNISTTFKTERISSYAQSVTDDPIDHTAIPVITAGANEIPTSSSVLTSTGPSTSSDEALLYGLAIALPVLVIFTGAIGATAFIIAKKTRKDKVEAQNTVPLEEVDSPEENGANGVPPQDITLNKNAMQVTIHK